MTVHRSDMTVDVLDTSFFSGAACDVAKSLLGMHLVREGREERFMITETEAYDGPHDLASHASKGRTPRTEVMFGPPGHWYVYLCYGMHWMLNVVTEPEGYPAAVLIRGVKGISGPGRVTRALAIDRSLNTLAAVTESGLWIARGLLPHGARILQTPRIGVPYAKEWKDKPWRYVLVRS